MRQRQGFTLVELLITMAILSILLMVLGALFVSTTRAYRVNETVSNNQQNIETAVQLLAYELALAGYRGVTNYVANPFWSPSSTTLHVTAGATASNPDAITVRFYEDRFCDPNPAPCPRTLTFGVNANGQLTRQEDSGTAQPVAEGVVNMKVAEYMLQDGTTSTTMPTNKTNLTGIRLNLTFNYGNGNVTRGVAVAMHNPQR